MSNPVLWDLDTRGVATVTFNRPEVNNAYDGGLIHGVLSAMEELGKKPSLRVVMLRGNGRHFQAGADLKWINGVRPKSPEENEAVSQATFEAVQRLNRLPIPTVALVQGGCFGGGTGIISACDVVIAADNALFSITEVRWGLTAAIIIPQLCDSIGVRQVRRYALTGERFGAEEARRIGLVHEVVPPTELEVGRRQGCRAVAGECARGAGRNQAARDGKLVRRHGRRRCRLCAAGEDAFGQAADRGGVRGACVLRREARGELGQGLRISRRGYPCRASQNSLTRLPSQGPGTETCSRTIEEPARQIPLYGEYEVVVLGGGPAGIAAAVAAARAGRRTLLVERYGFLGGMGTAAGVTNFCGLHANIHGEMHRVVQGIASDLLARIDRLDGLNKPHLILGKIFAQAYDTAAYKIAADDLLAAHKVDILFHALGAGVAMDGEGASPHCSSRPRPGGRRSAPTSSSIVRATAISPPGPGRRSRSATATATCSTPR